MSLKMAMQELEIFKPYNMSLLAKVLPRIDSLGLQEL